MQSYYSLYGSRLHLILEDEVAEGYNRAVQAFYDAQTAHKERTGSKWNPDEPLLMVVNKTDQKAHDDIARLINLLCEINGGGLDIPEEETPTDFLVKL